MAQNDHIPEGLDPDATIAEQINNPEPETDEKKRGRSKGGKNRASDGPRYGGKKPGFEVEALAQNIIGIHKLFALATGVPLFEITDDEGKRIAVAFSNLASQYDVVLDPRTVAWVNFIGVLASVYIPKYLLVRMAMASADQWQQPTEKAVN